MAGDSIAAEEDDLRAAVALVGERCRVRFLGFVECIRLADLTPERLAGAGVEAEEERFAGRFVVERVRVGGRVTLEDLDEEFAAVEERAGSVDPHIGELAELLREIARPDLLAGERERDDVARGERGDDALTVGDRRGRACVVLARRIAAHWVVLLRNDGTRDVMMRVN